MISVRAASIHAALLAIVAASPAMAQAAPAAAKPPVSRDGLHITGNFRIRAETLDGQFRPKAPSSDSFVSARTGVQAEFVHGPLRLLGEVVDTRGYAERSDSTIDAKEENALEPLQAYAAIDVAHPFGRKDRLTVTAGRFTIELGNNRLVGRTDYSNVNPSYLGGRLDWSNAAKDKVTIFWTEPFLAEPIDLQEIHANRVRLDHAIGQLHFWGVHATKAKLAGPLSAEAYLYRLAEEDGFDYASRNRHLVTFGTRLRIAPRPGKADLEIEAALQRGTARLTNAAADTRDLTVEAGFAHAEAGWTFKSRWAPRIVALLDYGSGQGTDPARYNRFDPLFGARRADLNPGGLFGPLSRSNLVSPGVRVEARPSKRLELAFTARDAFLASRTDAFGATGVRDATGRTSTHAGWQFEAKARRWLIPQRLRVEANLDWLAKGAFLRSAPNAPATGDTHYGYIEMAVTF